MFIVECPHCNEPVEIIEINCAIFRHAVFKNTLEQVPPHATREQCDYLIENNQVYGCCKPFKVENGKAIVCEYI